MQDCGCAFHVLRTLARVGELTTSSQVPLETVLQVTSTAERPSLGVLSCENCRQQRLPLAAVTILCAHLVDWLCRLWNLADDDTTSEASADAGSTTTTITTTTITSNPNTRRNTSNTNSHSESQLSPQPWRFSLGNYDLAADEADALSIELMILRLTDFSAVLGSLEAALITSGITPSTSSPLPEPSTTNPTATDLAAFAPACLDIVRANLRLVRTSIRRLKERSLLNGSGSSIMF
ncbi:hypothetical protein COCC4DRAFT_37710 [Bipolaris maydis ATCC 48331]|uniref:Aflatoxin regulatory protein domain-containing protein n=2 Tax=Cochliobolus heterostrophus TaxID=5016 RepID=M2U114_COCH5|nr:uncharacterized protein COCC4DRAFT_37710 [Bipolaris maydis ATCC 48331]EMD92239.1 hypothetical protein COCHEDRAFT_1029720 [Bipolaris maydis C5]KAJ5022094.1 hypothetical protein J3E73DRAFT_401672 [Bipolaris maydis]ENI07933.1 hypothetical protein COCC4DRAFT_37710 [Bipolaris maydis ATCC 48331]KAJ6210042.1 hypothetical protein PSV09DRAFT_1029720 [Bipolaris maydis]KAJ6272407.1 hypothetical protein PSV08DRAFT_388948 [Bipolaris maydis]